MASIRQRKAQRQALRWAQRSICAACCAHLPSVRRLTRHHPDYPTFDHVVPRSKGGGCTLDNGLLKHRRCNQAKGDRPPSGCDLIWLAAVAAQLSRRPVSFKAQFTTAKRDGAPSRHPPKRLPACGANRSA
jgi:hypothetical protein